MELSEHSSFMSAEEPPKKLERKNTKSKSPSRSGTKDNSIYGRSRDYAARNDEEIDAEISESRSDHQRGLDVSQVRRPTY